MLFRDLYSVTCDVCCNDFPEPDHKCERCNWAVACGIMLSVMACVSWHVLCGAFSLWCLVVCAGIVLPKGVTGLLAFVCRAWRIRRDGRSLHCLLRFVHYNVVTTVYLCFVVLWPQSLYLSINGRRKNRHGHWVCLMSTARKKERFDVKTHTLR